MIVALQPWQTKDAIAFCRANEIQLRPEGGALLRESQTPQEFYAALRPAGNEADARRVLAHFLPKRRALWWACLCTREAFGPEPPALVGQVLEATVQFVVAPSEERRWALRALYREAKPNTLAGNLAMAVFCSGGSLVAADLPVVQPRPFVTGRLVGVTVYLASIRGRASRYRKKLRDYLALGEAIARGRLLWTEATPAVPGAAPVAPPLPVSAVATEGIQHGC